MLLSLVWTFNHTVSKTLLHHEATKEQGTPLDIECRCRKTHMPRRIHAPRRLSHAPRRLSHALRGQSLLRLTLLSQVVTALTEQLAWACWQSIKAEWPVNASAYRLALEQLGFGLAVEHLNDEEISKLMMGPDR